MTLPDPLVSAEVDLRSFPFMALDVVRLQRSKHWLIARQNPEVGFYSLNLWMAAWHELPAASIENDDEILSALAGCSMARWQEVKNLVLRNWVLCSDNRLYHPVVAEKAREAWAKKLGRQGQTKAATIARNKKDKQKKPETENVTDNVTTNVTSTLTEETTNVTRSIREEKRREDNSVPNGTDADASIDPVKILFDRGRELLASYGIRDRKAGDLIGKWRKSGDERLLEVLKLAETQRRADIVAFVTGCLADKKKPTVQGLGRNLQSMEGGPFSNENGEFHVSGWAQTLGIDAVAEQMLKAKSAGWDRVKVIAHLDSLAAGKTRDNYQKPKETAVIISLVEDPHWIAVRDKHIDENPAAKSWLGVAVRSVYVNEKTVKIRMTSRTGVEQVQGYVSRLTELFKMQKPGIEIVEVGL